MFFFFKKKGLDALIVRLPPTERSEMLNLYRRKSILEDQLPGVADERAFTIRRQIADIQTRIDALTQLAQKSGAGAGKVNIVGVGSNSTGSRKFGFKKLFGK